MGSGFLGHVGSVFDPRDSGDCVWETEISVFLCMGEMIVGEGEDGVCRCKDATFRGIKGHAIGGCPVGGCVQELL